MRLVIAIFVLLGALSAQVVCRPAYSKGNLDSLFETKTIVTTDLSRRLTDYVSHPRRCFVHEHGTLALEGKIVHDWWSEIEPTEPFRSDAFFCPTLRSKENPLELRTWRPEWLRWDSEVRPRIRSVDFCEPTDTGH